MTLDEQFEIEGDALTLTWEIQRFWNAHRSDYRFRQCFRIEGRVKRSRQLHHARSLALPRVPVTGSPVFDEPTSKD